MSTINDVAHLAGVSTATVSRVINSPEAVREQTRERVRRAMDMCSYKYNALARGFAKKESRTIGLIIPSITNPIFAESANGVQDVAEKHGYRVVLGNTDYDPAKEARTIEVFQEIRVDGMLITTLNPKHRWLKRLSGEAFPFVILHSTIRNGPMSCVGVDNFQGGYMATRHLIRSGHRRIGMVAGRFQVSDKSHHRWYGFRKCLQDHGLAYDPSRVRQFDYSLENGRKGVRELMGLDRPPTALFCSNDYLALGAIKGAREMGFSIPKDLSVVGFDDMPMSGFFNPGLDTVRQPAYEMGKTGAELLMAGIGNPGSAPVQKMLDLNLIQRESVCAPKP